MHPAAGSLTTARRAVGLPDPVEREAAEYRVDRTTASISRTQVIHQKVTRGLFPSFSSGPASKGLEGSLDRAIQPFGPGRRRRHNFAEYYGDREVGSSVRIRRTPAEPDQHSIAQPTGSRRGSWERRLQRCPLPQLLQERRVQFFSWCSPVLEF
jgi:hypothetical protein